MASPNRALRASRSREDESVRAIARPDLSTAFQDDGEAGEGQDVGASSPSSCVVLIVDTETPHALDVLCASTEANLTVADSPIGLSAMAPAWSPPVQAHDIWVDGSAISAWIRRSAQAV